MPWNFLCFMILHPAFPILNFLELYLYTDCGLIVLGAELTKFPQKKITSKIYLGVTLNGCHLPKYYQNFSIPNHFALMTKYITSICATQLWLACPLLHRKSKTPFLLFIERGGGWQLYFLIICSK